MAEFDAVGIRNGTVVEATGIPAYRADVGIKAGKIAQISGRIGCRGSGGIKELGRGLRVASWRRGRWSSTLTMTARSTGTRTARCRGALARDDASMTIGMDTAGMGSRRSRPEDREANMQLHSRIEAIRKPLHSMRRPEFAGTG